MKLYDGARSGNCHKVRLLLSMLGLEWEAIPAGSTGMDTKSPEFLALNPRGQIPTLDDDGLVVWDSQAILVYLARRYGDERWLPLEPAPMAEVMQWMAVSENELLYGLSKARAILKFGRAGDLAAVQALAHVGLKAMETRLATADWLALDHPTIADLACFPYVAKAHEGEVPLDPYPAVVAWVKRIEALPGFVPMADIGA